ncbi:biotin/lipoyl-containing protein [Luteipulveratus halotolerans]|uniref:Lipoyl-binding domain-containing protein n=1 Tax=Luteipulveratus halotolerans TaxID=1631356 RepID=A0A0L6CJ98_9MICO|nr:biotin/lipoyl-containing protein [Luteipulveratus halotolerans]KNX37685.1 hypothetical protein VV01_11890 [Luteipulveratus halotolerans]
MPSQIRYDVAVAQRADLSASGQVAAPFAGVATPLVEIGQVVERGTLVVTIEAMKMEAPISAPFSGRVVSLVEDGAHVNGGDLIAVIDPT